MKKNKNIILDFGLDKYEDFIVANEQGLKELINGAKKALKDGEYINISEGKAFIGIKKVEDSYFDYKKLYGKENKFYDILGFIILIFLVISLGVGIYTILVWLYNFSENLIINIF